MRKKKKKEKGKGKKRRDLRICIGGRPSPSSIRLELIKGELLLESAWAPLNKPVEGNGWLQLQHQSMPDELTWSRPHLIRRSDYTYNWTDLPTFSLFECYTSYLSTFNTKSTTIVSGSSSSIYHTYQTSYSCRSKWS